MQRIEAVLHGELDERGGRLSDGTVVAPDHGIGCVDDTEFKGTGSRERCSVHGHMSGVGHRDLGPCKGKGITRADNNNFMIGEERVNGVVLRREISNRRAIGSRHNHRVGGVVAAGQEIEPVAGGFSQVGKGLVAGPTPVPQIRPQPGVVHSFSVTVQPTEILVKDPGGIGGLKGSEPIERFPPITQLIGVQGPVGALTVIRRVDSLLPRKLLAVMVIR